MGNRYVNTGALKLFCIATLSKYFQFSATLECYIQQWFYGTRVTLGDPQILFGDPKKGPDPQFENHWVNLWVLKKFF
jgi:hypothetical protein